MIYVDDCTNWTTVKGRRRSFAHLFAVPHDETELDTFAQRLGLKRQWRHNEHYDVTKSKREEAIRLGAVPVTAREGGRLRNEARKQGESDGQ